MAELMSKPQENISKIVDAIKQEAEEKADEIKKNAEEQFKIQKNKLVSTEKEKIMEDLKKRISKYEIDKRIQRSTRINEQRLLKMKARFDMIEKLKVDIASKILAAVADPAKYRQFIKSCIIQVDVECKQLLLMSHFIKQALIKLMEKKVELKVMKKDLRLAHELKGECEREFKEIVKSECKRELNCIIVINEDHNLEQEIPNWQTKFLIHFTSDFQISINLGGIVLTCDGARIQVQNTLNSRINLAFQEFLPDIRKQLFPQLK